MDIAFTILLFWLGFPRSFVSLGGGLFDRESNYCTVYQHGKRKRMTMPIEPRFDIPFLGRGGISFGFGGCG
jgi:hypothetical protein